MSVWTKVLRCLILYSALFSRLKITNQFILLASSIVIGHSVSRHTHTQRPWLFCSQSMWCGYSFILFKREMRECCCLYEKRGNGDQQLFHLVTHTTVGGLFNFWPKILRRLAVYLPFHIYKKVKNKHGLFFFSPLHITRIHTDIVCQFFSPPPPLSPFSFTFFYFFATVSQVLFRLLLRVSGNFGRRKFRSVAHKTPLLSFFFLDLLYSYYINHTYNAHFVAYYRIRNSHPTHTHTCFSWFIFFFSIFITIDLVTRNLITGRN